MALGINEQVDTVVIGNGPSALILSFILHGNIPYYTGGHHDTLLDKKLATSPSLLTVTSDVYDHFRSSLSYSSQALPINVLLDTLLRPNGDTELDAPSYVEWRHEPEKAISHIVLGDAPSPGGQWADNPVKASWDIGTLSYAEQLSLPGYSIAEHWQKIRKQELPDLIRPTRHDVAEYLAAYPAAVGIADAIRTSVRVGSISRVRDGFHVAPQGLTCKHLVLASGVFNINLPPPHFLSSLTTLSADQGPVLVVGSGFTAADIIISTPPNRKVIHLYNWDPLNHPSPLKGCHGSAYPEYAWIYRQMKFQADRLNQGSLDLGRFASSKGAAKSSIPSFSDRDWSHMYEGFPNSRVISTSLDADNDPASLPQHHQLFGKRRESTTYEQYRQQRNSSITSINSAAGNRRKSSAATPYPTVTVYIGRSSIGDTISRTISSFRYAAGRRGSLSYLAPPLLRQVLPRTTNNRNSTSSSGTTRSISPELLKYEPAPDMRRGSIEWDFALEHLSSIMITGQTLRGKIEGFHGPDEAAPQDAGRVADFEVAPGVFAIGSLTGDSLIRFAVGGCTAVTARIMREAGKLASLPDTARTVSVGGIGSQKRKTPSRGRPQRRESNPLELGHASPDALDLYAPRLQSERQSEAHAHLKGQDHAIAEQAAKPPSAGVTLTHRRKPSITAEILPGDDDDDDYVDDLDEKRAPKDKCIVS